MFQSIVDQRGPVVFPEFTGERIYMRPFKLGDDLGRWSSTVETMLAGVDTDETMFLMVDQSPVVANHTQRRPGLHIDGWWDPGSGHGPITASHRTPRHQAPSHRTPGRHRSGHFSGTWREEAIFLASDVSACRALVGEFDGVIGEGGDVSHLDLSSLTEVTFDAGRVYAGNVMMVHESTPVPFDCNRTVVRINVPHWRIN